MVDALEWHGADSFNKQELRSWNVSVNVSEGEERIGRAVGKVKSSGPLTFVTVEGAGHMVCFLPYASFSRFIYWLIGTS